MASEVIKMKKATKKKAEAKPAPKSPIRFLHVEISTGVMDKWVKFRNARRLKRGPLEEQALVDFMSAHDGAHAKPEVTE
jgi:hypothetical protein